MVEEELKAAGRGRPGRVGGNRENEGGAAKPIQNDSRQKRERETERGRERKLRQGC